MHLEKIQMHAVHHILEHNARSESEGKINRKNENINPCLTPYNYNLAAEDQPMPAYEFYKNRLKEIYVHGNASVGIVSYVIQAPATLPDNQYEAFFKAAYDFFVEKHGLKNVASSWIHNDETTKHMHFCFVPVVHDLKKGEKLCAKEVVTRSHLKQCHYEAEKYISDKLGYNVGIINGVTKQFGNLSVNQLKNLDKYIARATEFYNAYLLLCLEKEFDHQFEKMKKLLEEKVASERVIGNNISHSFNKHENNYQNNINDTLTLDYDY